MTRSKKRGGVLAGSGALVLLLNAIIAIACYWLPTRTYVSTPCLVDKKRLKK
jgi:hypothetical protein